MLRILKIKSVHFFEASVIVCQSTWSNIPEDSIVCIFSDHAPKDNSTTQDIFSLTMKWGMPLSLGLKLDTLFGLCFYGSPGMGVDEFAALKVDCVEK